MSRLHEALQARREIRALYGVSIDDECTRIINRERLAGAAERDKRRQFKWPRDYKRLYDKQKGVCARCHQPMVWIRGELHIDHFDPHRPDFNATENLRITHPGCNASKAANAIYREARKLGLTIKQLLEQQEELDRASHETVLQADVPADESDDARAAAIQDPSPSAKPKQARRKTKDGRA